VGVLAITLSPPLQPAPLTPLLPPLRIPSSHPHGPQILADEITPKLNTLREQRLQYLEWAKNNSEAERLARLCVAWEFVCAEAARAAGVEGQRKAIEEGRAATARIGELKALIAGKEGELKAREAARAGSLSGAYKKLMEEEESLGKKVAQSSAALANRRKALKDEENAAAALARARTDAEAAIVSLTAQLTKQRAAASEAAAAAAGAADEVSAAIARYNAAAAGMLTDGAAGGAGGGATTTAEGALMAAKARAASLAGDIASGELRLKHLKATARELEKAGKAAAADQAALQAGLARARGALEAKQAKLAGLGFNAAGEEALRGRREELSAAVSGGQGDRVEAEWASLAPLVDFSYDAAAMGAGWDRRAVRGTVASLLRVRVPEAATALEVAAGGRLFQVIVDSELVGKALLERGRLRRRVTLIPLNKVSASVIPPHIVKLAAEVSKGRAIPALECVDFDPALRPAMEYALGGMFLCPDAATAKAVCFHPGIGRAVVTYDGDVFDPSGTLEGGSRPDAGSGSGGPLLLRLASVREAMRALEAQRGELKEVEARLAASAKAAAAHAALSAEVELAATEVTLAQARLAGSAGAASEASAEETRGALEREEAALKAAAGSLREAQGRVRELEGEMANASKAREARTAAAEKALGDAKKAAAAAEGRAKKAAQAVDATACDLEAAERERAAAAGQVAAAEGALASSRGEAASAASLRGDLEERYGKAKAALEGAREELAAADRALKALVKERDAAAKGLEEAEGVVKKAEARAKQAAKEGAGGDAAAKELLSKHAWIAGERAFFGKPHTDYDFERSDPKAASARLSALEKQQGELERRINKKVIGMIEAAEREYADLVSKKRIIENDKAKIEVRRGVCVYGCGVRGEGSVCV
jgi:structural maintenance of chromosome 2